MPHASIRGQQIYFEDSGGPGLPLVLAHGFLMDHTMFDAQVRALAPDVRVIRWDARGFGQTTWDGKPFTYWDLADDCLALLDHLGLDRAVVGGMSQGGFTSLRVALRAPARVRALVLLSTQAASDDEATRAGYRQMLETWSTLGPVEPLVESIAGLILGPQEHWEPWVSRMKALPKESLGYPGQCLIDRDDVTARVPEIACPALVIHGTADQAIPFKHAEAVARLLPRCTGLIAVEGAAHAPNVTHPDQVNGPLREFLRAVAASD
jgi:pimeloyl-ACP methyl ester carboxylesterase